MLARFGETTVITRSNNRDVIEAALPELPERDRLRFQYVDLPPWARRWKRGRRGIHLYYLIWQVAAYRRARQLLRTETFDLTWHLTLANAWLGSGAALLRLPFVYGPVGGGVTVPWRLLPALGMRGTVYEGIRSVGRGWGRYLNPLARLAWSRARLILVQNEETRDWLPRRRRPRAVVVPNVVFEDEFAPNHQRPRSAEKVALFAGRLIPWKGTTLAVRSLRSLPGWRLVVVGTGSDERRMRRSVERLALQGRVSFEGQIPRERLLEMMQEQVDVLLVPSLREEAGWVVGEAHGVGLPVVSIDRGGPRALGARPSGPR
jgi:glycosyltransferase involved in cell wall biosynthesis